MRGLKVRLDALTRRRAESQRYVAVLPDAGGAPRSVVPLADGRPFRLHVPREFAGDPMAGLDERQRAFLWAEEGIWAPPAVQLRWPDDGRL
jgi:hypothetical protein